MYLSDNRRICRSRPRAASIAQQRREIHRSFGRYTAVLEERAGRMVLEEGMAPCLPSATRGIRLADNQERPACPHRRQPNQLDLRACQRQEQERDYGEDHVVVYSRRCRAKARPRRT